MEKKDYTVIIVSPDLSKIRQYRISWFVPRVLVIAIGIFIILIGYTQYSLLKAKKDAIDVDRLKRETRSQKTQIRLFAAEINELKEQMARLNAFDRKIRIITNLHAPSMNTTLSGLGGPEAEEGSLTSLLHKGHERLVEDMRSELNILKNRARSQEESFHQLETYINTKKTMLNHTPAIWPVRGWLTCGFGTRVSPFTGQKEFHQGLDIAAPLGTPIVAPADGVVVYMGLEKSYGKMLTIDHGFGFITRYGHISKSTVKIGERVKRGQTIALVGNTGRTTGPHLHYEVDVNGIPINPIHYILD